MNKGLDMVLSRDQEAQKKKILDELKKGREEDIKRKDERRKERELRKENEEKAAIKVPPQNIDQREEKEDKKMSKKNDVNKYFRIMNEGKQSSHKEKEPKKKEGEVFESETANAAPIYQEVIPPVQEKNIVEPGEIVPTEEEIEEENRKKEEEERRLAEERKERELELERALAKAKEEAINIESDIMKTPEGGIQRLNPVKDLGKEITSEEAEEIERKRPVLKRTILISRKEVKENSDTKYEKDTQIKEPLIEATKEAPSVNNEKKAPTIHNLVIEKTGRKIPLVKPVQTLGKNEDNDIIIDEYYVSRTHAKFIVTENGISVEDLNSTNGTFVNGEKIKGKELRPGDVIVFADIKCYFE